MTNIPPFYVGQRVVAIVDHSQGAFKKGDEFTVTSIYFGCCQWLVTIGIYPLRPKWKCDHCYSIHASPEEWEFFCYRFAPIHTDFVSITFEDTIIIESPLISMS